MCTKIKLWSLINIFVHKYSFHYHVGFIKKKRKNKCSPRIFFWSLCKSSTHIQLSKKSKGPSRGGGHQPHILNQRAILRDIITKVKLTKTTAANAFREVPAFN